MRYWKLKENAVARTLWIAPYDRLLDDGHDDDDDDMQKYIALLC
jgi:hypothetical protein